MTVLRRFFPPGTLADAGLAQHSEYLDRFELDTGTLVLFDLRGNAEPMAERCSRQAHEHAGRTITVLRL